MTAPDRRIVRGVPVAALVLAGVLAATSHTSVWAPARRGGADPLLLLAIVGGAFLLSFSVAGGIAIAQGRDLRPALRSWLPGVVIAAAILGLGAISRTELRPERATTSAAQLRDGPTREGVRLRSDWRGPATRRPGEPGTEASVGIIADRARALRRLLLAAGTLALALLAFLLKPSAGVSDEADPTDDSADERAREAAHDAIVGSIGAMLGDPDPRTAIIGAYARLQQELAGDNASRRDYEGPAEHLHRVLSVLSVRPSPLRTLIGLFEVARFSHHPLDASHRQQALAALRDVADDLRLPAATSAAGEDQ